MTRIVNFADGFSSNSQPELEDISASSLNSYISDGAYETAFPSFSVGAIYFNTTLDKPRIYTSGGWITIGSASVLEPEVPPETPNGIITAFTVISAPVTDNSILVFKDGVNCTHTTEWSYSSGVLTFTTAPRTGEKISFVILTEGTPTSPILSSSFEVFYHTMSGPEMAAKQFTLSPTPSDPTKVLCEFVGVTTQVYGVDYTVSGATFDFNGLGLDTDAILTTGDVLRIVYLT